MVHQSETGLDWRSWPHPVKAIPVQVMRVREIEGTANGVTISAALTSYAFIMVHTTTLTAAPLDACNRVLQQKWNAWLTSFSIDSSRSYMETREGTLDHEPS